MCCSKVLNFVRRKSVAISEIKQRQHKNRTKKEKSFGGNTNDIAHNFRERQPKNDRARIPGSKCLIIPEELPSLLSLVYSNIPPIKKGTDSRVGLGFRLGPHADFQVLLELGPQTNTDSLGSATTENPAKREIFVMKNTQKLVDYVNSLQNYFTRDKKKEKVSNTLGGKWIEWWRQNVLSQGDIGKIQFKKVPGIDNITAEGSENVIMVKKGSAARQKSMVDHLRQLYRNKAEKPST